MAWNRRTGGRVPGLDNESGRRLVDFYLDGDDVRGECRSGTIDRVTKDGVATGQRE